MIWRERTELQPWLGNTQLTSGKGPRLEGALDVLYPERRTLHRAGASLTPLTPAEDSDVCLSRGPEGACELPVPGMPSSPERRREQSAGGRHGGWRGPLQMLVDWVQAARDWWRPRALRGAGSLSSDFPGESPPFVLRPQPVGRAHFENINLGRNFLCSLDLIRSISKC